MTWWPWQFWFASRIWIPFCGWLLPRPWVAVVVLGGALLCLSLALFAR